MAVYDPRAHLSLEDLMAAPAVENTEFIYLERAKTIRAQAHEAYLTGRRMTATAKANTASLIERAAKAELFDVNPILPSDVQANVGFLPHSEERQAFLDALARQNPRAASDPSDTPREW